MQYPWWHYYRRKYRGTISTILYSGPFILLALMITYAGATHKGGSSNKHGIHYRTMAMVYLTAAGALWTLAKKLAAMTATEARRSDPRRPVLYFRAFTSDQEKGPTLPQYGATTTTEEALASLFRQRGPFIAIGAPGEALPLLGASRHYASDAEWRDWVKEQLAEAQLVVIRVGCSSGLSWEVNTALAQLAPAQLLLFLDVPSYEYNEFHESFAGRFPRGIPTEDERDTALTERIRTRKEGTKPNGGDFISFLDDWTPQILASRVSWWEHYRTLAQGHSPAIRYASALRSSRRPDLACIRARVNFMELVGWVWFSAFLLIYPVFIVVREIIRWQMRRELRRQ